MTTPLPVIQCCAPLGAPHLSDDEASELERVFKALADRHRVKILNRLLAAGGEAVCVCEFEDLLGLKQSTVSYHLKQLLDAGIIAREKTRQVRLLQRHARGAAARRRAADRSRAGTRGLGTLCRRCPVLGSGRRLRSGVAIRDPARDPCRQRLLSREQRPAARPRRAFGEGAPTCQIAGRWPHRADRDATA